MNNKGQSLVVFVILLPIFLIFIAFSVDLGHMSLEKTRLTNINKKAVKYLVKENKNIDEIKNIIYENDKRIRIEKINNNQIIITKKINSTFGNIINIKKYDIKSNLKGRLKGNKLIIEKG